MKLISIASFAIFTLLISCGEQGEDAAAPAEVAADPHSEPSDWKPTDPKLAAGRATYVSECSLCHDEGEEGAPALSNKKQWNERLKKEPATLIEHAIHGFIGEDGEMPARGGTESLSDEEVSHAVLYIIEAVKRH